MWGESGNGCKALSPLFHIMTDGVSGMLPPSQHLDVLFSADGVWGNSRCREDSLASFPCPSHWRRSQHHVRGAFPVSRVGRGASLSLEMESILPSRPGQVPQLLHSAHTLHRILCALQSLQSCLTLCNPMGYNPPGSSVHGILQQEYWSGLLCPPLGDLPDPRIEPTFLTSPALAGGSLLLAPPGKPSLHHISLSHLSSSSLV